jgi:hypothetical protein
VTDPTGCSIIEAAFQRAQKANPADVPFGIFPEEADLYHVAQASAYQYALEMMDCP